MRPGFPSAGRQHGSALIVSLVILIVMLLIGIVAMRTSTLEEKMAGNSNDRNLAFQAAEAALRDAEQQLRQSITPYDPFDPAQFVSACTSGLCRSTAGAPRWPAVTWDDTQTISYGARTGVAPISGVAVQPRYVVEYQGTLQPIVSGEPCEIVYLITARGVGVHDTTTVVLQSVLRRRAGTCIPEI